MIVFKKDANVIHYTIVVVLFVCMGLMSFTSIKGKSMNGDEVNHFLYGKKILNKDSGRISDSQMPITVFNAIPFVIVKHYKDKIKNKKFVRFVMDWRSAKYITPFFSLLFAYFIYSWSKQLYGPIPGLFSLFLYAFCPNIIGISRFVTTDLYVSGMFLIALYVFWKFQKHGGWKWAALSAIALGISQITKYSAVFLFPIFIIILAFRYFDPLILTLRVRDFSGYRKHLSAFTKYLLLYVSVIALIINAAYLFNQSDKTLGEYKFRSTTLKNVQKNLPVFNDMPLFLPSPYIEGMDWVRQENDIGRLFGNLYLLGELRLKGKNFTGFKGYYLVAFLFKVPIAVQLILILSILLTVKYWSKTNFLNNDVFLIIPLIFLFLYFNLCFNVQIGMRHFIPVFPLIYVFCGRLVSRWDNFKMINKAGLAALLVYIMISVLSYHPHYLSYMNEIVMDRKMAYKYLADSNIDYDQNSEYLHHYRKKHPDVIVHPKIPKSGTIIVRVNHLVGLFDPSRYRWLRENFQPDDHIAYSYLIYNISEAQLATFNLRSKD